MRKRQNTILYYPNKSFFQVQLKRITTQIKSKVITGFMLFLIVINYVEIRPNVLARDGKLVNTKRKFVFL